MLKIWTRTGILWVAQLFTSQEIFMAFHHYSRWEWWVLICSHLDWILHPLHVDFAIWWKKQAFEAIAKRTTQFFQVNSNAVVPLILRSSPSFGYQAVWALKTKTFCLVIVQKRDHTMYIVYDISTFKIILQTMNKPHVSIQLILCFSLNRLWKLCGLISKTYVFPALCSTFRFSNTAVIVLIGMKYEL